MEKPCQKRSFPICKGKSTHHHLTLDIGIGVGTKANFKQIVVNIWTKFQHEKALSELKQKHKTPPLKSAHLS